MVGPWRLLYPILIVPPCDSLTVAWAAFPAGGCADSRFPQERPSLASLVNLSNAEV